jgi:hypothetical protein
VIDADAKGTGLEEGSASTTISFGIPLAAAPVPVYVKVQPTETVETCKAKKATGETPAEEQEREACEANNGRIEKLEKEIAVAKESCPGSVAEPGAEPGHLCVFAEQEHNNNNTTHICPAAQPLTLCLSGVAEGADGSGAVIGVDDESAGLIVLNGSWAVTAE